jgi:RecA DNA recombination protein
MGIMAIDRQAERIPQSTVTQICVNHETVARKQSRNLQRICHQEQGGYKGKQNICREAESAAVSAKERISSGNSAVLFSLLAETTRGGHFCALVDASDCFDPASAEVVGVDLSRVLWIRCRASHRLKPLEQAFKATDILVHNDGFGMVVVDLGNVEERHIRRIPLTTWFRFARVVERKPVALVFLTNYPVAQSCAGLKLLMKPAIPHWNAPGHIAHPRRLSLAEMEFEIEVEQTRLRKPVQPATPKFTAAPVWA